MTVAYDLQAHPVCSQAAKSWHNISKLEHMYGEPPPPGEFCVTVAMRSGEHGKPACGAWIGMAESADEATRIWCQASDMTPDEYRAQGWDCFTFTVDPEVLSAAALLVAVHRERQRSTLE